MTERRNKGAYALYTLLDTMRDPNETLEAALERYISALLASDYLKAPTATGWKMDFNWALGIDPKALRHKDELEERVRKAFEGRYAPKNDSKQTPKPQRRPPKAQDLALLLPPRPVHGAPVASGDTRPALPPWSAAVGPPVAERDLGRIVHHKPSEAPITHPSASSVLDPEPEGSEGE